MGSLDKEGGRKVFQKSITVLNSEKKELASWDKECERKVFRKVRSIRK